jgi:glycosyltransferase involved in cell wall biosynthesis
VRILYLSFSYVPSQRANSVHVMKMCQAMARLGHDVTLVAKRPWRPRPADEDDFAPYGVAPIFQVRKLARPPLRGGDMVYTLLLAHLVLRSPDVDLVYCRHPLGAWLAARLGRPTVLEMHGLRSGRWSHALIRSTLGSAGFRRLILLSAALERDMGAAALLPPKPLCIVAHDGAEPSPGPRGRQVDEPISPAKGAAVGYVGGFYHGRGLALLAKVARRMPGCSFHLVGGTRDRLRSLIGEKPPQNMICHGYLPHASLGEMYQRFDVLVMPFERRIAVAGGRIDTARWASPLKMFEYMAAGKAIASSDLPVLREVLEHERNALMLSPEDPDAWVAALDRLLGDAALRGRLGEAARRDLETTYTWDARARRVLQNLDRQQPSTPRDPG